MENGRLLITGSNGFLGNNLVNYFASNGYEIFGTDLSGSPLNPNILYLKGDLTDPDFTDNLFDKVDPQIVINTVALVDMDLCEIDKHLAYRINVLTAENVAKSANKFGKRMIHISTDHFFCGDRSFYKEDDLPDPVNNYGKTKLEGEKKCLGCNPNTVVVRTNFYGWSHPRHKITFGEWMYESLARKKPVELFTDYYFTPIEVTALAAAIELVMESDYKGVINIAGAERCSKYEFGIAMAEVFDLDASSVKPIKMRPDSFKVKRQQDLSLSIEKFIGIFGMKLPNVKAGLLRFKAAKPEGYKKNE